MDARVRHIRYYRGFLLPHISKELFDTDDRGIQERLHRALKKRFCIDSLANLNHQEIVAFTRNIRRTMSVEWGLLCPAPNDPSNIDEMEMRDFLMLYLNYGKDERTINNKLGRTSGEVNAHSSGDTGT